MSASQPINGTGCFGFTQTRRLGNERRYEIARNNTRYSEKIIGITKFRMLLLYLVRVNLFSLCSGIDSFRGSATCCHCHRNEAGGRDDRLDTSCKLRSCTSRTAACSSGRVSSNCKAWSIETAFRKRPDSGQTPITLVT